MNIRCEHRKKKYFITFSQPKWQSGKTSDVFYQICFPSTSSLCNATDNELHMFHFFCACHEDEQSITLNTT